MENKKKKNVKMMLTFLLALSMCLQSPGFLDLSALTAKAAAKEELNSAQQHSKGKISGDPANEDPGNEDSHDSNQPLPSDMNSSEDTGNQGPVDDTDIVPTPSSPTNSTDKPQPSEGVVDEPKQPSPSLPLNEPNNDINGIRNSMESDGDSLDSFEVTGGVITYTDTSGQLQTIQANRPDLEPITDFDVEKGMRIQYQFELELYEGLGTYNTQVKIPKWLSDISLGENEFIQGSGSAGEQKIGSLSIDAGTDPEHPAAVLSFDRSMADSYTGFFWLEKKITLEDFGGQEEILIPFTEELQVVIKKPQVEEPEPVYEYEIAKEAVNKGSITMDENNETIIQWQVRVTAPENIPSAEDSGKVIVKDQLSEGILLNVPDEVTIQKEYPDGKKEEIAFTAGVISSEDNKNSDDLEKKDKKTSEPENAGGQNGGTEEEAGVKVVCFRNKTGYFEVVFNKVMEAGAVYTISYQSKLNVMDLVLKEVKETASEDSATSVTVTNQAEITEDKTAQDTVTIPLDGLLTKKGKVNHSNNTITWTITVNQKGYNIPDAIIKDTLPAGLELVGNQEDNYGVSIQNLKVLDSSFESNTSDSHGGSNLSQQKVTYDKESRLLTIFLGSIQSGYKITFDTSFGPGDYWKNGESSYTNQVTITDSKHMDGGYQTSGTVTWENSIIEKASGASEDPSIINWKIKVNKDKRVDMSQYEGGTKGADWIVVKDKICLLDPKGDVASHWNRYKIHEFEKNRDVKVKIGEEIYTFAEAVSTDEVTNTSKCYYIYQAEEYCDNNNKVIGNADKTGILTFYIPSSLVNKNTAIISYSTKIQEPFLFGQNITWRPYWNYVGLHMGTPAEPGKEIDKSDAWYKGANTVLGKKGSFSADEKKIHWTITVNESNRVLSNVKLTDIISPFSKGDTTYEQTYLAGSLVVKRGNTILSEEEVNGLLQYPEGNVASGQKEGEKITFQFKKEISEEYTIKYDTEVEEKFFTKNQKDTEVKNQVTLVSDQTVNNDHGTNVDIHNNKPIKGVTVTATVKIKSDIVSKSGSYNEEEQQENVINWTVDLNKNKLTLKNPVVTDKLHPDLKLALGTVELYKLVDGMEFRVLNGYKVNYQEVTNVFTFQFGLDAPGGIEDAYRLKFSTDIKPGAELTNFTNQVDFSASMKAYQVDEGGSSKPIEKVEYRNGLGISSSTRSLKIIKVDAAYKSLEELLEEAKQKEEEERQQEEAVKPGQEENSKDSISGDAAKANIKVEEMDITPYRLTGAKFQLLDQYGNVLTEIKTTQNGDLEFAGIRYNRIYILREIEAPNGYYKGGDFVFRLAKVKSGTGEKVTVLQQVNREQAQENYFVIGNETVSEEEGMDPYLSLIVKNSKKPYTPSYWTPTDDPIPTEPSKPETEDEEKPDIPEVPPKEIPDEKTVDIEEDEVPLGPGITEDEDSGEEIDIDEDIPTGPAGPEFELEDSLPQTGTMSIWVFYGMGVLLILLGAAFLIRKKREQ